VIHLKNRFNVIRSLDLLLCGSTISSPLNTRFAASSSLSSSQYFEISDWDYHQFHVDPVTFEISITDLNLILFDRCHHPSKLIGVEFNH
jgi:hypothetical protein